MTEALLGKRGRWLVVVLVTLAAVLVVLIVWAIIAAAVNATESNERGESRESQVQANDQALTIIRDCTETDGACFKANQRRLADAVSDIGATNILAVVCALQVPNGTPLNTALDQVTACVVDRLKLQPKP